MKSNLENDNLEINSFYDKEISKKALAFEKQIDLKKNKSNVKNLNRANKKDYKHEYTIKESSYITNKQSYHKFKRNFLFKITFIVICCFVLFVLIKPVKSNKFTSTLSKSNTLDIQIKEDPVVYTPKLNQSQTYMNKTLEELKLKCDFDNPATRKFYLKLAANNKGKYNIGQIIYIHNYLVRNWKYVNDPNVMEIMAKASESIENNLTGDCDDFAILMASCIMGIGGTSRIVLAEGSEEGHAFTEVYVHNNLLAAKKTIANIKAYLVKYKLMNSYDNLSYRVDADGSVWLNLDWTKAYPGGNYFKSKKEWIFYINSNKYRYTEKVI